jgi:DNA-binding MarR family transcriptional regulator
MTRPSDPTDPFPPATISRADYLADGSDAWFRRVLYRFIQSADRLQRCREGFGQEAGLTGNQYIVLMGVSYLAGNGGVTIAALAAHVGLAAPHVTTEVGRLLRRGLLHKRPNHEDKRSVLVSLTDTGRDVVRDVISVVTPTNDILFHDIDRAELEALLSVSEKLVRNAELALAHLRVLNDDRAAMAARSDEPAAE